MRKVAIAIVVIAVIALIAWRMWPRAATTRNVSTSTTSPRGSGQPSRVRRLGVEERKQLGAKIDAAIQRAREAASRPGGQTSGAATAQSGSAPTLAETPIIKLEDVAKPMQEALQDAIPLLADCYAHTDVKTAAALMKMTSDPELGTVIDTDTITDADGKPLDPKVDTCLRDTIDSLALPPLGQLGTLNIQYTFRFDE